MQGELSHRQQWFKEHKKWLWFTTILSAFVAVYLSLSLSIESLALLIPLGVIVLLYPLPIISLKGRVLFKRGSGNQNFSYCISLGACYRGFASARTSTYLDN